MQNSKVRIIAGEFKRRKISFNADDPNLRPTLDRIRETIFNWLATDLLQSNCLDLFAGSGIFGFEAISRGANFVAAIENNPATCKHILANKLYLNLTNNSFQVINQDVLAFLRNFSTTELATYKFDVVFLDPPYAARDLLLESLNLLTYSKFIPNNSKIYFECGHVPCIFKEKNFPQELKLIKASNTKNIGFYLLEKHNY